MRDVDFLDRLKATLVAIEAEGFSKSERLLTSMQGPRVVVLGEGGEEVSAINLCANNYLGLAADARVVEAGRSAAATAGSGLASVRFICGTHILHKELESEVASYLEMEDALLFAAAFDANGAIFEPLLDERDAIVSDALNHASIIDGIRLSKAARYRYATNDLEDLERQLKAARRAQARTILIVTDGVFSMDGVLADLKGLTRLAEQYRALVMVDDCHATGVVGPQGRGVAALQGLTGQIDIITGTFGKALGGAMGGFVAAKQEIVDLLRQRARPYLFSNALAPSLCGAALAAIRIARGDEGDRLRQQLSRNTHFFRQRLASAGFDLTLGDHPIVPVQLGEARIAQAMATALLRRGVFVTAFSYPVVPNGRARIRVQLSASHTCADLDVAADAFIATGRVAGVIK